MDTLRAATLLDRFEVVDVSGPDAAAFLHAQLTTDVVALRAGDAGFSAWLGPQGRAIVVLGVLREDERIRLLVPHARGADVAARLARFVLRSKVRIAPAPEARVAGLGARADAKGPALALPDGRALVVVDAPSDLAADDGAWALADVRAGVPWLDAAVAEQVVPQALGLGRLGGYSVTKGCYPGQEIVARTHFLGRNKRLLVHYAHPGPPLAPGDALGGAGTDGPSLVIADVAVPGGGGREGLAVLHEDVLARGVEGAVIRPFGDAAPGSGRGAPPTV